MGRARLERLFVGRLRELRAFLAIGVVACALGTFLSLGHGVWFARFFGFVPVPLAFLGALALGAASLIRLRKEGALRSASACSPAVGTRLLVLAAAFALPVVVFDVAVGFPADINVPAPGSLAFYPAMAFAAQVFLHLGPFAVMVAAIRKVWPRSGEGGFVFAMGGACLIEPAFQAAPGFVAGGAPGIGFFTALIVFAFGMMELAVLRRHGFGAMYGFRLAYYLIWHIAWGHLRLSVLF